MMRHSSLRVRRLLVGVAISGLLSAGTTGAAWVLGADPHPAHGGLPGAREWPAAVAATAAGIAPPDPAAASPAQVRRFWAALTERQRRELARRAPGVVGNLDGIPSHVRYAANERARRATDPGGPRPAGRLLGYDPRGDGRVILVLGELASARRVAVIVPGSGWSLRKLLGEARTTSSAGWTRRAAWRWWCGSATTPPRTSTGRRCARNARWRVPARSPASSRGCRTTPG
jgi:hypothetical protein